MAYTLHAFDCDRCGKHLEAHVATGLGFGAAGYTAKCPACGKEQGTFPDKVIEVVERSADLIHGLPKAM